MWKHKTQIAPLPPVILESQQTVHTVTVVIDILILCSILVTQYPTTVPKYDGCMYLNAFMNYTSTLWNIQLCMKESWFVAPIVMSKGCVACKGKFWYHATGEYILHAWTCCNVCSPYMEVGLNCMVKRKLQSYQRDRMSPIIVWLEIRLQISSKPRYELGCKSKACSHAPIVMLFVVSINRNCKQHIKSWTEIRMSVLASGVYASLPMKQFDTHCIPKENIVTETGGVYNYWTGLVDWTDGLV